MGQMIDFPANGGTCSGYLAAPDDKGPGIVVIQEWWGLVDHIKDVCDRLAAEGFVALAPDLYRGEIATEPDEASKKMMELKIDEAAKDMGGAFDYMRTSPTVFPHGVGCVGFCMGGALSLVLATRRPVGAAVVYYGLPNKEPDYSKVEGSVLIHFAEHDGWASAENAQPMLDKLDALGIETEVHTYPGTSHAFFNDSRPEVYDKQAAELSWSTTIEFFRKHLVSD